MLESLKRVLTGLLLASALGGCLSGQTGSPDCVGPRSCVCDPLYGAGSVLRVRVESMTGDRLSTLILEVLPTTLGHNELKAGDRIGGTATSAAPCATDTPIAPAEGDELLVLFSPGSGGALLDGYYAWITPWTDPIAFGASHELAVSELSVLASPESCRQRFPADPAPPCNDTRTVACAAAANEAGPSGSAGIAAMLLAAALWHGARRRRSPLHRRRG